MILKSGIDLRDLLISSTGVELTFEEITSCPSEHCEKAVIIIKVYQQIDKKNYVVKYSFLWVAQYLRPILSNKGHKRENWPYYRSGIVISLFSF